MILDKQLMFDEAAALTATRNSTNVIDLLRAGEDWGRGEELYWFFQVITDLDSAAEGASLQVALVTSATNTLGTPTILQDLPAVVTEVAMSAAFPYVILRHLSPVPPLLRYLGLVYTVSGENFTSGTVSAGIVKNVQSWKAYASNYVSA